MRAWMILPVLVACAPETPAGTYFCGPEELCPEGLVCDRTSAICENSAKEFTCGANVDVPGDDTPATAQSFGELNCVSLIEQRKSCLPVGDIGDFYTFTVAASCTTSRVKALVTYPLAFERVVLQLGKAGEPPVTMESPCPGGIVDAGGSTASCLDAPVAPGTYVLGVVPDGTGTCDNECRFNRYNVSVQIVTQ